MIYEEKPMNQLRLLFVTAATLFFAGCYFSATIVTRISLSGEGANPTASVTIEYANISSGEAKLSDVKNDFDQLIRDWQGDQYLLDRAEEGFIIKNRELFILDGKIIGRETGVMKNLNEPFTFWVNNGERIMPAGSPLEVKIIEVKIIGKSF
jgi:hypothetical protein